MEELGSRQRFPRIHGSKMSAEGAARSIVSIIFLLIGAFFIISAAIDFVEGFGLLYAAVLFIIGVIFLAVSNAV